MVGSATRWKQIAVKFQRISRSRPEGSWAVSVRGADLCHCFGIAARGGGGGSSATKIENSHLIKQMRRTDRYEEVESGLGVVLNSRLHRPARFSPGAGGRASAGQATEQLRLAHMDENVQVICIH